MRQMLSLRPRRISKIQLRPEGEVPPPSTNPSLVSCPMSSANAESGHVELQRLSCRDS